MAESEVHGHEVHHTVSGIAFSMASRDAKLDETFEGIKEYSSNLLAHICRAPFSACSGGPYGTNAVKTICNVCQGSAITVKALPLVHLIELSDSCSIYWVLYSGLVRYHSRWQDATSKYTVDICPCGCHPLRLAPDDPNQEKMGDLRDETGYRILSHKRRL